MGAAHGVIGRMSRRLPITVVGSINRDIIVHYDTLPLVGETVFGQHLTFGHGGKGANQAFAASRLGGDVAMVGRVGQDDYGAIARQVLATEGCAVAGIRTLGDLSGQALVLVGRDAGNRILVIKGANGRFTASELERDAAPLARGGFVLLQLEIPLETVVLAAGKARAGNARVLLDPAPAIPLPPELLQLTDILTPNQTELAALTGSAPASPAEVIEAAQQLRARGPGAVIVKMGAEGCLLLDANGPRRFAAPGVTAIDTTGAGDCFNAALAVSLSEDASLADACRFAVAAASLSVTRQGAQASAPQRVEVEDFLAHLAQQESHP